MKYKTHKLCTFEFENGTRLRAAVPAFNLLTGLLHTYEETMSCAKAACWEGNEENGRGRLLSFSIDPIAFPIMIQ